MLFTNFDQIESKEYLPGFHGKAIHTEHTTTIRWKIDDDAELPEHEHVHEQVTYVVKGVFEMHIGGKIHVMKDGDIAVIPSRARHSGKAITSCELIDIFYPVREDLK